MTPQDLETSNRSYDILAAVAVGVGTAFLFGFLYLFLGLLLGVIGIHRSPTVATYLYCYWAPVALILGVAASIGALRYFRKASGLKQRIRD